PCTSSVLRRTTAFASSVEVVRCLFIVKPPSRFIVEANGRSPCSISAQFDQVQSRQRIAASRRSPIRPDLSCRIPPCRECRSHPPWRPRRPRHEQHTTSAHLHLLK